MNYERLRECAKHLEERAKYYAAFDAEAARFYGAIKPWLAKAEEGLIPEPLEADDLPGRFYFLDGGLRKYRDLGAAYAEFAVHARDDVEILHIVERALAKKGT